MTYAALVKKQIITDPKTGARSIPFTATRANFRSPVTPSKPTETLALPQIHITSATPTASPRHSTVPKENERTRPVDSRDFHNPKEVKPNPVISKKPVNYKKLGFESMIRNMTSPALMEKLQRKKDERLQGIRTNIQDSLRGFSEFQKQHPVMAGKMIQDSHDVALEHANKNPIQFYPTYEAHYKNTLISEGTRFTQQNAKSKL